MKKKVNSKTRSVSDFLQKLNINNYLNEKQQKKLNAFNSFFIENILIKLAGVSVIIILLLIVFFILSEGLPFLKDHALYSFITGEKWIPLSKIYGLAPLIAGSAVIALTAIIIAIPLSIGVAIFISEIAPERVRSVIKLLIEVLASIPSVVFGFIGIIFLGPALADLFQLNTGATALTAAILLALMAIPTITSIADESLRAVPKSLRQASLALGATEIQTIFRVTLPSAFSGIFAGIMLGIGRAIGETMTVMMVAGGAAQITMNVFKPMRTMTGTIAAEMGETQYGDEHYQALFMIGLVLFLITLAINTLSGQIVARIRNRQGLT